MLRCDISMKVFNLILICQHDTVDTLAFIFLSACQRKYFKAVRCDYLIQGQSVGGGGGGTGWQQPWDQDTFTDQRNLFKVQSSGHFVKQAWHTCWENKQLDGISFDPLSRPGGTCVGFSSKQIQDQAGSGSASLCVSDSIVVSLFENTIGSEREIWTNYVSTSQRQKYIWTSGHQTLWTEFCGETHEPL